MSLSNSTVLSVNISEKKGTVKTPVPEIKLNSEGIENDAHAGQWHRQVSLLGVESMNKFNAETGKKISFGEFGENITTSGIELHTCQPLDKLVIGSAELEITQIGKKCHGKKCAIYTDTGDCIMPKEGIFTRVIKPGTVKPGDTITYLPKIYRVFILTLSDRASKGIYPDLSGPKIKEMFEGHYNKTGRKSEIEVHLLPDDAEKLEVIIKLAIQKGFDIIITNGGTGLGPNDITIETVSPILDKQIPGITEYIRVKYGAEKPNALVSRSLAGLAGRSLIFCLPGSVKAVEEYSIEILRLIDHLVYMVHGLDHH